MKRRISKILLVAGLVSTLMLGLALPLAARLRANLKRRTAESPVSEALRRVGVRRLSDYTVMLITGLNHDADAIAYQSYQLKGKGVSVINV